MEVSLGVDQGQDSVLVSHEGPEGCFDDPVVGVDEGLDEGIFEPTPGILPNCRISRRYNSWAALNAIHEVYPWVVS
jgi:hypothetical protein